VNQIRLSSQADLDVAETALFLSSNSTSSALRFLEEFALAVERLVENPRIGHPHRFLVRPELLVYGFRHWLIVYITDGTETQVVRVIQGSRDLASLDI
jgi:plasmid stabilization system protein ParE